jgi:hypothetical protein
MHDLSPDAIRNRDEIVRCAAMFDLRRPLTVDTLGELR